MQSKKSKVISLHIDSVSYDQALDSIIAAAATHTRGYVCFANAHMVIEAYQDKGFADQVNNAMLVVPDGMPVVNAVRSIHKIPQERIAGMDVMPDLIRLAEKHDLRIFFFGSSEEVLQKIKAKTKAEYPKATVAGSFSPPFSRSLEDKEFIQIINNSQAHIIFVALGCPKQEKWMAANSPAINGILVGVGGAFPVYAGITSRAPLWLRKLSLEWVYRLMQEPVRLFKRYLVTNTLFLYLIIKQRVIGRNSL